MAAEGTGPGVHSLDHFAIAVPDLSEARSFYESFGLDVREEGAGLSIRAFGSDHLWGRLILGPVKRLKYLSFAASKSDFVRLAALQDELGSKRIDPPAEAVSSDGLWFQDLNGLALQIRLGRKTTLDAKEHVPAVESLAGVGNAPLRGTTAQVRPTRLSHVLIFVPDVPAAVDFYNRSLGLRLSDQAADVVAFMHAVHGCDHHLVAFAKSEGTGLHHSSWDVPSIEDVGRGAMQMRLAGFDQGWGLGRHVLGSNYFQYIRDPWGSYAEYSHDMDYIPSDMDWGAKFHDVENSLYLWGPDVPEDFVKNYEI